MNFIRFWIIDIKFTLKKKKNLMKINCMILVFCSFFCEIRHLLNFSFISVIVLIYIFLKIPIIQKIIEIN